MTKSKFFLGFMAFFIFLAGPASSVEAAAKPWRPSCRLIVGFLAVAAIVSSPPLATLYKDYQAEKNNTQFVGYGINFKSDRDYEAIKKVLSPSQRLLLERVKKSPSTASKSDIIELSDALANQLVGDYDENIEKLALQSVSKNGLRSFANIFSPTRSLSDFFKGVGRGPRGICRQKAECLSIFLNDLGIDAWVETNGQHLWVYLPVYDLVVEPTATEVDHHPFESSRVMDHRYYLNRFIRNQSVSREKMPSYFLRGLTN